MPSVSAQAVLLILNAARARARQRESTSRGVERPRSAAPRSKRSSADLDAHVAFAAAAGGLERYRGERDYRLWKVVSEGGSRSEEWWARIGRRRASGRGTASPHALRS